MEVAHLKKPHVWLRLFGMLVVALVVLAVIAGFSAGPILKRYINDQLAKVPDYDGHVDQVSVSLLRGKYILENVVIRSRGHEDQPPLVAFSRADVNLEYRPLLHGEILASIDIDGADLTIAAPKPRTEPADKNLKAPQKVERWQDVMAGLFPIEISDLHVTQSRVHYVDQFSNPKVDVSMNIETLNATGLSNQRDPKTAGAASYPARLACRATTTGNGVLTVTTSFDPLADWPHFILRVELDHVDMPPFNDFLEAYANADVAKGNCDLETEMRADRGHYDGYVKPFFRDLNFDRPSDKDKPLGKRIEKKALSLAAALLRNDQGKVATRAPFSGDFKSGGVETWPTIMGLLRNAFIQALRQGFDGQVPKTAGTTAT